ncbi:MAG TPA: hypothetical protein VF530_19385 [Planctomycetota bacterium]
MRASRTPLLLFLAWGCAAAPRAREGEAPPAWHFLRTRYDRDGDGRIERAEYTRSPEAFRRLDADGDGVIAAADFDERWEGVPRIAAAPGSEERWIGFEDFVHGEGGPEVGDPAPPIHLPTIAGAELSLEAFRGAKPVVLVFGSYT